MEKEMDSKIYAALGLKKKESQSKKEKEIDEYEEDFENESNQVIEENVLEYSETVEDVKVVKDEVKKLKSLVATMSGEIQSVKQGQSEPISVVSAK